MSQIDPMRHLSVFPPHAFGSRRVDVIGCGATGSRVVMGLAKLGVEHIHAWDFDGIESHNVANQLFGLGDIGRLKVEALAEAVKTATGTVITAHAEAVDGSQFLGEIVFLLTDTMISRKEIWDGALKFKLRTKLMIETRMGADEGRVYSINPNRPAEIRGWEDCWYPDQRATASLCGASVTVGSTAEFLSGLAVWQMIRWFAIENRGEDELDHEILFTLRPPMFVNRRF